MSLSGRFDRRTSIQQYLFSRKCSQAYSSAATFNSATVALSSCVMLVNDQASSAQQKHAKRPLTSAPCPLSFHVSQSLRMKYSSASRKTVCARELPCRSPTVGATLCAKHRGLRDAMPPHGLHDASAKLQVCVAPWAHACCFGYTARVASLRASRVSPVLKSKQRHLARSRSMARRVGCRKSTSACTCSAPMCRGDRGNVCARGALKGLLMGDRPPPVHAEPPSGGSAQNMPTMRSASAHWLY